MTRVVAVRHGETDWNREGRLQGWAPVPINETGFEQAAAVGEWLAEEYDVDRMLASDSLRTRQTAETITECIDPPQVSFEAHWRERHLGVYQGLAYVDVAERFPQFGLGESAHEAALAVPESGESLRDLADRVTGRFDDVTECHPDETVFVVTHGGPIHVLLGYAKGLTLPEALGTHYQSNCGVTEFRVAGDEVTVERENVTAWKPS